MMVHFRKRFPVEEVTKINEFICTGKWPEAQRNVDRNVENDHEPSVPPIDTADEVETSSVPSKQSGKPNRITSQKKKNSQQKEMFDNNTHVCADRIVSLEQPHVRPINRGKRSNPTEFGQKLHLSVVNGYTFLEQTSWNNFNEGTDLQAAVEDYFRKFGCYPTAVLADKIYQTCANKLYCKQWDIQLSGPPLGRRRSDKTDTKLQRQMYKDSC